MIKSEELKNPESCLNKALPNEMVFVLLGRDASAPETIKKWALDRVLRGKNKQSDDVIREAYLVAAHMDQDRERIRKELKK